MFVPVLIISVKYDPEGNILFAPEVYNTMEEHVNISIVAGTNFHSITQRTFSKYSKSIINIHIWEKDIVEVINRDTKPV